MSKNKIVKEIQINSNDYTLTIEDNHIVISNDYGLRLNLWYANLEEENLGYQIHWLDFSIQWEYILELTYNNKTDEVILTRPKNNIQGSFVNYVNEILSVYRDITYLLGKFYKKGRAYSFEKLPELIKLNNDNN